MKNRTAQLLVLVLISCVANLTSASKNESASEGHWVSAWGSSMLIPIQFPGMPAEPPIVDKTIRMVVRPTISGSLVRVRLSNEFSKSVLVVGAVHIAETDEGSKIKPETDRVLTFGGKASISIPAGAPMLSDPVRIHLKAFSKVSISIYLPSNTPISTWHFQGQDDSYLSDPGDRTEKVELPDAPHRAAWYFLSGLEIWAPPSTMAIVALGDSITQGTGPKPSDVCTDWPYQLAQRIAADKAGPEIAVVNEGIGGNRVLHDAAGVSALARFDRDVLAQAGVNTLILLEGINDIGFPRIRISELKNFPALKENPFAAERVSAAEIVAGLQQIAMRAHEHGIRVFGATVTPFEGTNSYDAEGEAIRQEINRWIRSTKVFDGIFDFDAVLRDPDRPSKVRDIYDSGDHIHPGPAGYKAMADSVPLGLLRGQHR